MQQNSEFVLNAATHSSSGASIITFLSNMEALISDVLKTVIRSRPLPLLAKGFFDDCIDVGCSGPFGRASLCDGTFSVG